MEYDFDQVMNFHEATVRVKQEEKWGLYDVFGQTILPFSFKSISNKTNHKYVVSSSDGYSEKYGIIDSSSTYLVPCMYDYISGYSNGLALCKTYNGIGYLD